MIDLPDWPGPQSATPRLIDFGGFLTPGLGGAVQRINRQGSRYAVTVAMPPLENRKQGRIWVNRLVRGKSEGVRLEWPLLDFDPGAPNLIDGTPIEVDGAGQSGVMLTIRNVAPGYAFLEGQPVSLEVAGQHYFDFIAATSIANAAGDATIQLSQMLRVSPPDGAVLHVAKPMIEGFVMGDDQAWELALNRTIGLSFEIQERR